MDERRNFSRIRSGISCLVYSESSESVGVVENISESGIAIRIQREAVRHDFRKGETIMATGLDAADVVQFELEIMRLEEADDHIIIGAHIINSHDVEPYVYEKRLELLKNIYIRNCQ